MGPAEAGLEEKDGNQEHDELDDEQLALKLHRLGRTCFRKVGIHNCIRFKEVAVYSNYFHLEKNSL